MPLTAVKALHVTVTARYAHLAPEQVRVAALAVGRYRAQSRHIEVR
ncbi:MAG: hypothetical protein QF661_10525 [Arenicellales bacterium]|jgi:hypothetical protein|nr:hypothetical protein [Arenicellales bacterium]MDP7452330.1 hypothetical protein [Arenicellales bacterium]MDP7524562.1 hypothetical protein [Arenicellales bacterium]MDP7617991.1 hypothetical protein [Arenicellales bacterium]